jgi:hypothetical protein
MEKSAESGRKTAVSGGRKSAWAPRVVKDSPVFRANADDRGKSATANPDAWSHGAKYPRSLTVAMGTKQAVPVYERA